MSMPTNHRREHSSTYVMQYRSNDAELNRLQIHDQLFNAGMGGVLPEQPDTTAIQRVLDVGCGTGGWLIEAAKTYPTMSQLIGVDVSNKMLDYAQAQARALQVEDRVEFHQMDSLRMLDFPDKYFDLVNERFAMSWLRTWDWPKFLQECQRVVRPGGVIRVTEYNVNVESTSPALMHLGELAIKAFYQAGHIFSPVSDGVTKELAALLHQYGLQHVQTRTLALEHRADTAEGQLFIEDWKNLYRGLVPFLQKWTHLPDDYEDIYQRMVYETQQPDFVATTSILTAWGTRL